MQTCSWICVRSVSSGKLVNLYLNSFLLMLAGCFVSVSTVEKGEMFQGRFVTTDIMMLIQFLL